MGYEFSLLEYNGRNSEMEIGDSASSFRWMSYDPSGRYLALNIDAMAEVRKLMQARGMLNDCEKRSPEAEDFGLQPPVPFPGTVVSDDPAYRAFENAIWDWLAFECERPGIPIAKLSSNDGWLITPAQIDSALKQGERFPAPASDIWVTWMHFLKRGAASGGIVVW